MDAAQPQTNRAQVKDSANRSEPWQQSDRTVWSLLRSFLLLFTMAAGCRPETPTSPAPATPVVHRQVAPEAVLASMLRAYRQAPAYSDRGEIVLTYRMDGRRHRDAAPLSFVLERPNRLRLRAYQVDMVADVGSLMARIADPRTQDIDGQVVTRRAPEPLTLSAVLEDPMLQEVLSRGLGRLPVQLELLLGSSPLGGFLDPNAKRRLLDDGMIGDQRCHRVEVRTSEGAFVLWIDAQQFLLRRMEYPTGNISSGLPEGALASDMGLIAEFHEARFQVADLGDFELWEVPRDAKMVRRFVRPPLALPTNIYGQLPRSFELARLDGSTVTHEQLKGKITLLHWYVDHPSCRASLEQLAKVAEEFSGNEELAIYTVCAEADSVPSEQLEALWQSWGLDFPILRDLSAVGRDVFNIEALPALVVLDRDGAVQLYEVTYNPRLAEQLKEALAQLLRGEDVGLGIVAQAQQDTLDYQQWLAAAGHVAGMPESPAASQPEKLKLVRRWSSREVTSAGNLVLVPAASGWEAWVLNEGREIVRLDEQGAFAGRVTLEQPAHERASILRVAASNGNVDAVATADLGGMRVNVFRADGGLLFSAPPPELRHGGVRSVEWADADGNGTDDLCVCLADDVVVAWNLAGEQVLAASVAGARSVVPARDATGGLLVTGENGRIARVVPDQQATIADPHPLVPVFELHRGRAVNAASDSLEVPSIGVSYDLDGNRLIHGLGEDLAERWTYTIPGGAYATPLHWVVPAPLPNENRPGWIFAGSDGSIHFVSGDGTFYDYFFLGQPVRGLDGCATASGPVLVVASGTEITAWEIKVGE